MENPHTTPVPLQWSSRRGKFGQIRQFIQCHFHKTVFFCLFPIPKFPEYHTLPYLTYVLIIYWSLISMFLLLLSTSQHSPVLPPSWKSVRPCNLPETPRPWYSSATFLSYIPSRRLHKDASHQLWRSWPPSWRIPPSCKKSVGVFPKQKKNVPFTSSSYIKKTLRTSMIMT